MPDGHIYGMPIYQYDMISDTTADARRTYRKCVMANRIFCNVSFNEVEFLPSVVGCNHVCVAVSVCACFAGRLHWVLSTVMYAHHTHESSVIRVYDILYY